MRTAALLSALLKAPDSTMCLKHADCGEQQTVRNGGVQPGSTKSTQEMLTQVCKALPSASATARLPVSMPDPFLDSQAVVMHMVSAGLHATGTIGDRREQVCASQPCRGQQVLQQSCMLCNEQLSKSRLQSCNEPGASSMLDSSLHVSARFCCMWWISSWH